MRTRKTTLTCYGADKIEILCFATRVLFCIPSLAEVVNGDQVMDITTDGRSVTR
jgi:hypothetical protein